MITAICLAAAAVLFAAWLAHMTRRLRAQALLRERYASARPVTQAEGEAAGVLAVRRLLAGKEERG